MADIVKNLDFNDLAAASPAPPPTGYTQPAGSNNARIVNLPPKVFNMVSGATQALWYDNTVLVGTKISSTVVMGATAGSAAGPCLVDSTGSGDGALQNDGQLRVFRFVNGQLGTQVGSAITNTNTAGDSITMEISDGIIKLFKNGSRIGGDYAKNTGVTHQFAGAFSRGAALRSMSSLYSTAYTISTLTDPMVVGAAFSGTTIGYTDGVGTLSYGGRSVPATIASNAFSGTAADLIDNTVHPFLPATGVVMTLAKGAESATITRDIPMIAGHNGVTFSDPMNIINPKYITTAFNSIGAPILNGDRGYIPAGNGLIVGSNGSVASDGPMSTPFWLHRASDSKTYRHTLTINDSGDVTVGSFTSVGLTSSGLTMRGLTAVGL